MSRRSLTFISCLVGMAMLAGCQGMSGAKSAIRGFVDVTPKATYAAPANPSCGSPPGGKYVGLSVNGFPPNTAKLDATERAFGVPASVVSMYYSLGASINMQAISELCAEKKLPLIEIETDKIPLTKITDGSEDATLANYAIALSTMQVPVAVDFNHEFNGPWFGWGYTHTSPSEFVAAWRHTVNIFRDNGATNVRWIWNPNVDGEHTTKDLGAWYPGDGYVTWIGLDGYFYAPGDTFTSVFDPTLNQIRQFTKLPWLIVETGANPESQRVRAIGSVFSGAAKAQGLLGIIWFDYNKFSGHNWYINNDPAALAAFRADATAYQRGS